MAHSWFGVAGVLDSRILFSIHPATTLGISRGHRFPRLQAITLSQNRTTRPGLFRTAHTEGWILRESLDSVANLIARHAAVDGLAEQICQWKLGILPVPRIGQVRQIYQCPNRATVAPTSSPNRRLF